MNYKIIHGMFLIQVLICSILLSSPLKSQDPKQSVIDINNITSWVSEEGFHDWIVGEQSLTGGGWNGNYPNGTAGSIFSEGIVWGGIVYDGGEKPIRVNGNTYGSGNKSITRLFRVRPDYYDTDLTNDAANFFLVTKSQITGSMIDEIYNQYKKDWNEWPIDKGAPFYDKDSNGVYDPNIDIPGVPGASQTILINYNDELSYTMYGSPPIGLEVQETYWAYYTSGPLKNVIYKKVDIIYKGTKTSAARSHIDSMYIAQWVDTDIGNATDDFAGCDTTLNLGYAYNSSATDLIYSKYLPVPPAVGYSFLQGAAYKTENYSDSAIINFKWQHGYKYFNYKPLNVCLCKATGTIWSDPGFNYNGTLEWFNLMRGYLPIPRYPSSQPFPSYYADYTPTGVFFLTGDPITGTGNIDGTVDAPGDRRLFLISGPFNLSLGDTVEVVIALVGGSGINYLSSISLLKYNTSVARLFYSCFIEGMTLGQIISPDPPYPETPAKPENYVLQQNYPNPFNSSTTIKYEVPAAAYITLIVYDILGREISRLVNTYQEEGRYTVNFNADDLPSGVYFYKISFNNSESKLVYDTLYKIMKMILIK